MDPVSNPYTPNAGARPQAVVGRDDQLSSFDLLLKRMMAGRTEQSMIVTGLRGVGKTVLLGRFYEKALSESWVVIELEVRKHDNDAFRRELASLIRTALFEISPKSKWTDRMTRAAGVLRSFTLSVDPTGSMTASLNVDTWEGLGDHGTLSRDLTDLLVAVGEAAKSKDRGVVLLFDEIQFLSAEQLEAVISAVHKTVQRTLPIILVGAGLPQIAELAGDAKSYAERLFKFPTIGNLLPPDDARGFADPAAIEHVQWNSDALARALEITEGYPYFVQELGYAVWPIATGYTITAEDVESALPIYESKLDSSFFRVRLDRSTELQRAYLRAMAELGPEPQKAAAVAELLNRSSTQCGPTRAELIAMGLLYTPDHGYAAFTVPQFDRFMKRAMPRLEVPAVRQRR